MNDLGNTSLSENEIRFNHRFYALNLCLLDNLSYFCCLPLFFLKNSFRNTISVSNSLDPDQAQCFVRSFVCFDALHPSQQFFIDILSSWIEAVLNSRLNVLLQDTTQ